MDQYEASSEEKLSKFKPLQLKALGDGRVGMSTQQAQNAMSKHCTFSAQLRDFIPVVIALVTVGFEC